MILIAASRDDAHAAAVADRLLTLRRRVIRLDPAELTESSSLELSFGGGHHPELLLHSHRDSDTAGDIDLARASVGWWRQRSGRPSPSVGGERARAESFAVAEGVIASLALDWLNPPAADSAANHAVLQWTIAAELGFALPRTIVTRNPDRARSFADGLPGRSLVTKSLRPHGDGAEEIRRLDPGDDDAFEHVRAAPTLIQEYVEGVDLRVVVVGEQAFAVRIEPPLDPIDILLPWDLRRGAGTPRVTAVALPGRLDEALVGFVQRLGLGHATIDLRRTDDDRHVVLDLDPSGAWLFIERATGLPITDAVAGRLAERDQDPLLHPSAAAFTASSSSRPTLGGWDTATRSSAG
ncbi:RimK family alpha-L-glutamate ligase [Agromyces sp. LHK192]|uniref:ATP-grasp domain-containing protein n=1 Tax=Agromyces sp. LHK192 TaxID=2498704 RepID=UPI000FDC5BB1|nr:hypothetical protein [Agromyces sp. LHK192]